MNTSEGCSDIYCTARYTKTLVIAKNRNVSRKIDNFMDWLERVTGSNPAYDQCFLHYFFTLSVNTRNLFS